MVGPNPNAKTPSGITSDAHGGGVGVIDPTKNVLDKVDDAVQRLDDLRSASDLRQDDLRKASERRLDELADAERRRVDEVAALHAGHVRELNEAETKRIDAIRAVDVAAVAIASERAVAAADVLANQVTTSAETLRALVATTAAASTAQTNASNAQLSDRITLLERSSYEGSGKSAVTDPAMARMIATMEQMSLNMAKTTGKEGISTPLLVTAASVLAGIVGFIIQTMLRGG